VTPKPFSNHHLRSLTCIRNRVRFCLYGPSPILNGDERRASAIALENEMCDALRERHPELMLHRYSETKDDRERKCLKYSVHATILLHYSNEDKVKG